MNNKRKDPFDDPFFKDPDAYFRKTWRGAVIGIVIFALVFGGIYAFIAVSISNQVEQNGGLGHSIGKFFGEIKSGADEASK